MKVNFESLTITLYPWQEKLKECHAFDVRSDEYFDYDRKLFPLIIKVFFVLFVAFFCMVLAHKWKSFRFGTE
jgi:hypothetical protein